MELKPGITGSSESFVTRSQTARSMDSGALEVFATPAMIALPAHGGAVSRSGYDHRRNPT